MDIYWPILQICPNPHIHPQRLAFGPKTQSGEDDESPLERQGLLIPPRRCRRRVLLCGLRVALCLFCGLQGRSEASDEQRAWGTCQGWQD